MDYTNMLNNPKLSISSLPPYDPLQAFVRENHIALEGVNKGQLKELTFAAKDVFKILGSTYGNGHPKWLETNTPDDFTTSIIMKLLEEGADLVGKTVCDELCFSISGENWNYGSPINPHDPRRYAGGSSSGSGVAVAGGLVDFSLGSDCLGSVRVPASYNGVLGMRPTYERVPNDGEAPYCESMDVLGYMSSDTEVFRKISKVILGEDKNNTRFKKLLVAKDCFDIVDTGVKEALRPAMEYIGDNIDLIEEIDISPVNISEWVDIFRYIQGYEVWESYGGWIRKYRPRLSRGPKERLEWASSIRLEQYQDALNKRLEIIDRINSVVCEDTLLCMPTVASIAPLRTTSLKEINKIRAQSSALLCISPLTGIPQVTLPMVKQHNLPLGISLLGAQGRDLSLVNFGTELLDRYLQ